MEAGFPGIYQRGYGIVVVVIGVLASLGVRRRSSRRTKTASTQGDCAKMPGAPILMPARRTLPLHEPPPTRKRLQWKRNGSRLTPSENAQPRQAERPL